MYILAFHELTGVSSPDTGSKNCCVPPRLFLSLAWLARFSTHSDKVIRTHNFV